MDRIEVLVDQRRFKDAAWQCADLLEKALRALYARIKDQARRPELETLLAIEGGMAEAGTAAAHDGLSRMVALYRQAQVLALVESVLGRPLNMSRAMPLESFLDLRHGLAEQPEADMQVELDLLRAQLRLFLKEAGLLVGAQCPACAEPVKAGWSFCPYCETPLEPSRCIQCRQPIKPSWKRCPECGARLRCFTCGARFTAEDQYCPQCAAHTFGPEQDPKQWAEPLTGMLFVLIPEGVYQMGDTFGDGLDNERPLHDVRLGRFYMAIHPVTQQQWRRVMPTNPSAFKGELRPVERVSWPEAQSFAGRLNELSQGRFTLRLPTEAEWEYAARSGGKAERFAGGRKVDEVAWYDDNSSGMTQPVGRKAPNGLGLYDMSGNVWEWCLDSYRAQAYAQHGNDDPVVRDPGPDRVIRGGSWNLDAWSVRCARRMGFPAAANGPGLGLRLAMFPAPPP